MEKLLLKVEEACKMTDISRSVGYDLLAKGIWPKVIVGKSSRVPLDGLRKWVEENTIYERSTKTE